ncbi:MAG: hypothetical protein QXK63_01465, partial [Thermoproteus sp.]
MAKLLTVKKAYVEGVTQRRIRYTFVYDELAPLSDLIRDVRSRAGEIAAEWGAELCEAELPSVAVLAIRWMGGSLLADLSICFPISRPLPRNLDIILGAKFDRISLCLEPMAPIGGERGTAEIKTATVKRLGRIALRGGVAVVKLRGLYFLARASARPHPAGGVVVEIADVDCRADPYEGLMAARRM